MGVRKNYRSLTAAELQQFIGALRRAKASGAVDRFARIHDEHFSHGIHRSSHFLPWHREFILRFERILQETAPGVVLPYWDSTMDIDPEGPLWARDLLGQFDAEWRLRRALGSAILPPAQLVAFNQARPAYGVMWRELERDIHNAPHRWVSGVMGSGASPGDPVFYFHHCWIDMLWARWQSTHPGAVFESSGSGLGLDDPLMEWPDRTPADVMDHRALGYTYDFEDVA